MYLRQRLPTLVAALLLGCVTAMAVPPPDGVHVDTLVYAEPGGYPLHLYLLRAADATGQLPCILYVQGSSWRKQRLEKSLPVMAPMARMGYAVACVEYRPCNVALFPAQVEDAKTATRFIRKHSAELGIDPDNLFAWGTSSGAHTVLMQAFTQDSILLDPDPGSDVPCRVNAVIDYYGPTELVHEFRITKGYQENPDANGGLLLGDPVEEKRDVALKASPLYYVNPCSVPVFVVHGEADRVVPLEQSEWLIDRLAGCGARVESLFLPGKGHGGKAFWTGNIYSLCDIFLRSCAR